MFIWLETAQYPFIVLTAGEAITEVQGRWADWWRWELAGADFILSVFKQGMWWEEQTLLG